MTKKEFIEFALINDVSFSCAGREYFILQDSNFCICGEYGNDETTIHFNKYQDVYRNIEDMLENWRLNEVPLNDLVEKIEFYGN